MTMEVYTNLPAGVALPEGSSILRLEKEHNGPLVGRCVEVRKAAAYKASLQEETLAMKERAYGSDKLKLCVMDHPLGLEASGEDVVTIVQSFGQVRELDLSETEISDIDVDAIITHLVNNKLCQYVEVVNLDLCRNITQESILFFLTHCENLKTIRFFDCDLGNAVDKQALIEAFEEYYGSDALKFGRMTKKLIRLELEEKPWEVKSAELSYKHRFALDAFEIKFRKRNAYLAMSFTVPRDSHGNTLDNVDDLLGLVKAFGKVRRLDLSGTNITDSHMNELIDFWKENGLRHSIKEIKLDYCGDISDETIVRLFKHCKFLKYVDFYNNNSASRKPPSPAVVAELEKRCGVGAVQYYDQDSSKGMVRVEQVSADMRPLRNASNKMPVLRLIHSKTKHNVPPLALKKASKCLPVRPREEEAVSPVLHRVEVGGFMMYQPAFG
tara:strand:- start:86755 stop:88074 length:1320 start_codon:yes stop_codon:yes gene_type:complete